MTKSYRIDPAYNGIHIVDIENGCERVYIKKNHVPDLINDLQNVMEDKNGA